MSDNPTESINQPDFIFEKEAALKIAEFLNKEGKPLQVVKILSDKYKGLPIAIKKQEQILKLLDKDFDFDALLRRVLTNFFIENLSLLKNDENTQTEEWIKEVIIKDVNWREMVYLLSNNIAHEEPEFVKKAIKLITETENIKEIYKTKKISTKYLVVFNKVFVDLVKSYIGLNEKNKVNNYEKEDNYLKCLLGKLEDLFMQTPATFVVSLVVFNSLVKNKNKAGYYLYERILLDLIEICKKKNYYDTFNLDPAPLQPENNDFEIKNLLKQTTVKKPYKADFKSLHEKCLASPHLVIQHLQNENYISNLLQFIFSVEKATQPANPTVNPEMGLNTNDYALFILAFVTTYNQNNLDSMDNVQQVFASLRNVYIQLPFKPTLGELGQFLFNVSKHLQMPVVASGLIVWTKHIILNTRFYETYYRSNETPITNKLLEEISRRHPFLRPLVFQLLKELIENPSKSLGSMTILSLKKCLLNSIIYLMQLGYTIPTIEYITSNVCNWDESLCFYCLKTILTSVDVPFSVHFALKIKNLINTTVQLKMKYTVNAELLALTAKFCELLSLKESYNSSQATSASDGECSLLSKSIESYALLLKTITLKMQ